MCVCVCVCVCVCPMFVLVRNLQQSQLIHCLIYRNLDLQMLYHLCPFLLLHTTIYIIYIYIYIYICVCVCVCACVCVSVSVSVCVLFCERERERESVYVCVRALVCVCVCVSECYAYGMDYKCPNLWINILLVGVMIVTVFFFSKSGYVNRLNYIMRIGHTSIELKFCYLRHLL